MASESQQSHLDDDLDDLSEDEEDLECDEDQAPLSMNKRKRNRGGQQSTNRGVTLSNLLSDGILESGEGVMSIDYLGKKFIADLLSDGRIQWTETMQIFNSPSAWAIHCKKLINPDKKSGCGWASVKYRGKKLDIYKSTWIRKHKLKENEARGLDDTEDFRLDDDSELKDHSTKDLFSTNPTTGKKKKIGKATTLGQKFYDRDSNILVECTTFSALGKIQPFTVTITTTCLLLVDFHSHLNTSEVVGYLAGVWDVDSHNLAIQRAFPCKCKLDDVEKSQAVEDDIRQQLEKARLTLVGWYHSHPYTSCNPSVRDIVCQMDYQIKLKGESAASYTPCVGLICAPYNKDASGTESSMQSYWVMPPPENRPQDIGRPMLMNYGIVHDIILSQDMLTEMRLIYEFYKGAQNVVDFNAPWKDDLTHLDKLLRSLSRKCPGEQSDVQLTEYVQNLIMPVVSTST